MTKQTCDLCGADSPYLLQVLDHYQTEEVKEVCPGCEDRVNDALREMRRTAQKFVEGTFKTFLRNLRAKFVERG